MSDFRLPDDSRLDALVEAATAPAEAPLPGEAAALAAFRAQQTVARGRRRRPAAATLVVSAAFGGAILVGGVAAATTGNVPFIGSGGPAPAHAPATPGSSTRPTPPTVTPASGAQADNGGADGVPDDEGKGSDVTDVARASATPGPDKGAAVCDTASDGSCDIATARPTAPAEVTPAEVPTTPPVPHRAPVG